jgi:hypothetical protein
MRYHRDVVALAVVLLALLAGMGGYLYFTQGAPTTQAVGDGLATSSEQAATSSAAVVTAQPTCHESQRYFIVEQSLAPNVGTDFIVKTKATSTRAYACAYVSDPADYEIMNAEGAEYFLALEGNYLLTDNGTAPGLRGLTIYDLTKRTQVFTDTYEKPVFAHDGLVEYWTDASEKATAKNCKQLKDFEKAGLGAVIEAHITLNLSTLTKKLSTERRCNAVQ